MAYICTSQGKHSSITAANSLKASQIQQSIKSNCPLASDQIKFNTKCIKIQSNPIGAPINPVESKCNENDGKCMKNVPKVLENGSQNPDIFNDISTLCAKWQTAFGSRRRGRIEVWASCFHALGVHWRSLFLLLVFDVFWGPPGAPFLGNGGRGATPYN